MRTWYTYGIELADDTLTNGGGCWVVPLALGTLMEDWKKKKTRMNEILS